MSDLISVLLVLIALKVKVEIGWCGVEPRLESRALISGFPTPFMDFYPNSLLPLSTSTYAPLLQRHIQTQT